MILPKCSLKLISSLLIANIFVMFGGRGLQQTVGITIGIVTDRTVNRGLKPKNNTIFTYRQEKIKYARTMFTSRGHCYQKKYT